MYFPKFLACLLLYLSGIILAKVMSRCLYEFLIKLWSRSGCLIDRDKFSLWPFHLESRAQSHVDGNHLCHAGGACGVDVRRTRFYHRHRLDWGQDEAVCGLPASSWYLEIPLFFCDGIYFCHLFREMNSIADRAASFIAEHCGYWQAL